MNTTTTRGLWLACALLSAAFTGAASGVLTVIAGAHPAVAIIASAAGFTAATQLLIKIMLFLAPGTAGSDPTANGPNPTAQLPSPCRRGRRGR